jgi:hypothetical protein
VAKAHGGPIEIFGVTVAQVDDKVRLQAVDTWMDSLDMFRQIAPNGIIAKEPMNQRVDLETALDVGKDYAPPNSLAEATKAEQAANPATGPQTGCPFNFQLDGAQIGEEFNKTDAMQMPAPQDVIPKHISDSTGLPADAFVPNQGADTQKTAFDTQAEPSDSQNLVQSAAAQGADADLDHVESNFHDAHEHQESDPGASQGITTEAVSQDAVDARPLDVESSLPGLPRSVYSSAVSGNLEDRLQQHNDANIHQDLHSASMSNALNQQQQQVNYVDTHMDEQKTYGTHDAVDQHLESSADHVHPHPHTAEDRLQPRVGEAVTVAPTAEETRMTHEEMSRITPGECPSLMNRE